ncbi:MAG TPA: serine hydrolase domain-containing protein [Acidimicrobiia bacterium]|nr:serine hydrolase domain-containing protein [Acidimicrobiia bacterium]
MTTIDELVAAAGADVERGAVPACQVAAARDGDLLAFETFGDASDTTRFCIFSATKPIVASAIWLLLGDGSLDVDRPIADDLPELAGTPVGWVTLEQVLLHTAGFPSPTISARDAISSSRRLDRIATWTLEWEPGSRFEYHSESAHWVLAALIERVSGLDFRDFVEQRVCAPLGLPRVLGLGPDDQEDIALLVPASADAETDPTLRFNTPEIRAVGNPGGGAFMTAADLARFYQALLTNPDGLWDAAVLRDATSVVHCDFDDPLMGIPANRSRGLVLAGDDGMHTLRYAIFGHACSPGSFGHAGAHGQVAWADPATGISFAYLANSVDTDPMRPGTRASRLASLASALAP